MSPQYNIIIIIKLIVVNFPESWLIFDSDMPASFLSSQSRVRVTSSTSQSRVRVI